MKAIKPHLVQVVVGKIGLVGQTIREEEQSSRRQEDG
jgi:hypothetical protein